MYIGFIKDFSKIARPLNNCPQKDKELDWLNSTIEALDAFDTSKSKLVESPMRALLQPQRSYMVDTNASTYAFGALLFQ